MENIWIVKSEIFQQPFTCLIAGPTQSGKTHFIKEILKFKNIIISEPIERVVFCFSSWQPLFQDIKEIDPKIEFNEGIINFNEFNPNKRNLLILDDLVHDCENDTNILNLFTVDSHHKNISVFLLTQNLFSQGKFFRTISLNSNYMVLFKNPRDKSQINVLARQIFPNNVGFFLESFSDAVENQSHSYLFLDLKQQTLEKNRVQTGILPGEKRIIYTPK